MNEQDHSGGENEPDGMMSSLAKSKGAQIGFFSVPFSSIMFHFTQNIQVSGGEPVI